MKINVYYFLIIFIVFVVSCKTNKRASNIPYMKMNEKSRIDLPFKVSKQEIIDLLDNYFPDTLFQQEDNDDFPVNMKIEKGEIIDLNMMDSILSVSLSLDIDVSKTIFGITATSKGSMLLDISSDLDIDDKWHLVSKTTIESIEWINKPEIKAGFIKFSVPSIVLDYLESKKTGWLEQLDSTLYKNEFLQKSVYSLDSLFQHPFPIDSAKSVGAKLKLENISLFPFETSGDSISGGISVMFDTQIVPVANFIDTNTTLGNINFSWKKDSEKEQKLVFALSFIQDQLQNVVNAYMDSIPEKDRYFDMEGLNIRLDKIDVIYRNGLVGGRAYISGDKNGDIFILCRPYWDKNDKKLLLLDRDVKIKMDDIQSKTLLMLFGKKAKKKTADILEKNINELIYGSIYEINDSLSALNENNTIRIDKFDLPVQLEQDMLFIDIYLHVKGRYVWKKLNIDL